MTKTEAKPAIAAVNELFGKSPDGLREIVRAVVQEMLEAEMTDARGREGRTHGGSARLPIGLLHPHPCHPARRVRSHSSRMAARPPKRGIH